jgi:hypothetical protein
MPRYFFNVHDGSNAFIDGKGKELPDRYAAWPEATNSLRDLDGKLKPVIQCSREAETEAPESPGVPRRPGPCAAAN